ncbi:MAG: hypothetical protein FJ035_03540 [Chloroflexi bacterium]|nr:hypothetical protein [Chloroflexota bacterium]
MSPHSRDEFPARGDTRGELARPAVHEAPRVPHPRDAVAEYERGYREESEGVAEITTITEAGAERLAAEALSG